MAVVDVMASFLAGRVRRDGMLRGHQEGVRRGRKPERAPFERHSGDWDLPDDVSPIAAATVEEMIAR